MNLQVPDVAPEELNLLSLQSDFDGKTCQIALLGLGGSFCMMPMWMAYAELKKSGSSTFAQDLHHPLPYIQAGLILYVAFIGLKWLRMNLQVSRKLTDKPFSMPDGFVGEIIDFSIATTELQVRSKDGVKKRYHMTRYKESFEKGETYVAETVRPLFTMPKFFAALRRDH